MVSGGESWVIGGYPLVNVMDAYGYPLVNGGLMVFDGDLSSGKRLQFANWKITIFKFGKSPFLCAIFNSKLLNFQRVQDNSIINGYGIHIKAVEWIGK